MSIVNTTYLNNKSIKTCLTGWKLLWTNRCNKALFPVLLSPTTTMVHLVSLAILVMIRLVCFFHIKTIILFTILVFFHVSKLVSKLEKKCERTSQTYGTATTDGSAVRRVRLSAVPLLCSSARTVRAPRSALCLNITATELNEETTCSSWRSVSSCDVVVFQSEKGYIFYRCEFQKG